MLFYRGHQVANIFIHLPSKGIQIVYSLCQQYITSCTLPADPLVNAGRFSPLSQVSLNKALRHLLTQAGLNQTNFTSHSFRISTTTTATAEGIPSWIIKSLGRWASNTYLTYIHRSPSLTPAVIELM